MSGGGIKVKIRGVYATAITKLLADHGFEIVQPSVEIAERIGAESSEDKPDLNIRDRQDRQGFEAVGTAETVKKLSSVLANELFDVILRTPTDRTGLDVEFPWHSKTKLDEHRRALAPTIKLHHFYKACGGFVSSSVDMAENLISRGRSPEEVELLFRRTVEPYLPFEGSVLGIEHVKLIGPTLNLGKATIDEYCEAAVEYSREMRSGGTYDGLGVDKEPGDRAITEAKMGEYYTTTRYFSREGRFKGTYINLGTPVEVYPSEIRYVDLETDICVWPGGQIRVVDEELLENAASQHIITERLCETTKETAKRILDLYEGRLSPSAIRT